MFRISAAVATAIALTAPAFAGGIADPAPAPVIVPIEPVEDWTGAYGGLQVGTFADATFLIGGEADTEATIYGAFAGYRYDFGRIVVGAEIDYMVGQGEVLGGGAFDYDVDYLTRFGIEVGYDLGDVLVYATAGIADIELTDQFGTTITSEGQFFGAGADYRLSDNFTVGAELLHHQFSDFPGGIELDALTFGVNVAFTF